MDKSFRKIDIKAKKLLWNLFLWNYKSAFKWRWLEFSDFRLYDIWDDSKRIDWLVSAREWKTLVRRYEEDRELDIMFVLDLSTSMKLSFSWKSKIELLKEIFYILWLSAVEDSSKIGAYFLWWTSWKYFPYKKWKANLINIFNNISIYNNEISENYNETLDLLPLLNLKVKNNLVFVLSDKIELLEKNFKVLSFKNDLVYINIFNNFENTLSWEDWIVWLRSNKNNLFIDLDNKKKIEEFRLLRKARIDKFKKSIYSFWADYLYIDDKVNIFKKLLMLMKKREQ